MRYTGGTGSQRPPPWLQFLMFGPAILGLADGCFRQPTETTTTAPPPPPTQSTSMEDDESTQFCNEEQQLRFVCWHDGTCFAKDILGSEILYCHCQAEYTGEHCEEFHVDPNIFPPVPSRQQHMRTAHIAAGVAVCILVIFVILLAIYVWLRQKKLRSRRQKRPLVDHDHNKKLNRQSLPINGVDTSGQHDRGKDCGSQNGNHAENGGYRDKMDPADGDAYPLNGNNRQVDV